MNEHEITLGAEHSQQDYVLQRVFLNLTEFVTKNHQLLYERAKSGKEITGFDTDLLFTFQQCFNPIYPY